MNNVRKPLKDIKEIKDKHKVFAKSHTNFFPKLISNQRSTNSDFKAKGKATGRNNNYLSQVDNPNKNMNFIYSSINSDKEMSKDIMEKDLNKIMKNKENLKINLNKRELLINPPSINAELKNSRFNSGTPEPSEVNKQNFKDPSFRKLNQFKTIEDEREGKNNSSIPFNISNYLTNEKLKESKQNKGKILISSKNIDIRESIDKKEEEKNNIDDVIIENNNKQNEKLNFSFKYASFYDQINETSQLKKNVKIENSDKKVSNNLFERDKIERNEENRFNPENKEKKVIFETKENKTYFESNENKSDFDSKEIRFNFNSNANKFKTKTNEPPEDKKPDISEVLKRVLINNKKEAAVKNREIFSSNPQNYINLERTTNSAKYFIDNSQQRRNFGELKKNSIEFVLKDILLWKKHEELWINLANPSFTIGDLEKYILPPNDFDILLSVYYKNNNITLEKLELNEKIGNFKLEMSKWKDAYKKCLFRWHPDKLFPLLDRLKFKDENRKANLKKKCGVIVNNINKQLASVLEFLRSFIKNNN